MHNRIIICFLISFSSSFNFLMAQELDPKGTFLLDSIKIGEEVPYTLSVTYPRGNNIIFPDSLYDFTPFEFVRKVEFLTKSDTSASFDSVVYYLSTFEVDPVQKLALPIFLLTNGDSTAFHADQDSIILKELISQLPDSVVLKENASYQTVSYDFNYPYFIIGLFFFFFIILIVFITFGGQIKRKIRLYRLKKKHKKFIRKFDLTLDKVKHTPLEHDVLLIIWKKYMEKLENAPYTKLTTKEITKIQVDNELNKTLKEIDKSLYGNYDLSNIETSYSLLKDYASERLYKKMEGIKNA